MHRFVKIRDLHLAMLNNSVYSLEEYLEAAHNQESTTEAAYHIYIE